MNYKSIKNLTLECSCRDISLKKWERLMKGNVRANIKEIDRLVKLYLPSLYSHLALNHFNPYIYYKTKTHLILVHSGIEYFLRFKQGEETMIDPIFMLCFLFVALRYMKNEKED